ncbi:hypothetical protein [Micromonospora endophytica]|uniref:Secreted protein n=1 Tax=Micromonospora endophytica TaxID=515350 RepID=A0A2W2D1F2_9ACTN|nr:hypothetical protein [Micromonospora endophytica]PZF86363.1 hypothetical protein C1I93_27850 [Micromonospora endophytica]RIW45054.1 hypothetical protein D3H59_16275 [Micromonospora endophytica]
MAKLFSRRSVVVAVSALALALAGGGIAAAQPTTVVKAPLDSVQAAPRLDARGGQPVVTPAEARQARAALKKSASSSAVVGTTSFAVVGSSGNLIRGRGAVSATKYGAGQYQVLFNRNVTRSAYLATIGTDQQCCVPPAGEISVAPRLDTPNAVFIQTYDSTGVPADRPFHLAVFS